MPERGPHHSGTEEGKKKPKILGRSRKEAGYLKTKKRKKKRERRQEGIEERD